MIRFGFVLMAMSLAVAAMCQGQTPAPQPSTAATPAATGTARGWRMTPDSDAIVKLSTIHMRDVCIMPDPVSKLYYMIASAGGRIRAYTSKDLVNWQGPKTIFNTPPDIWGDIPTAGIWAPEMHYYNGKYYMFFTFDTRHKLPEQWRQWRPRVTRGAAIVWSDSPTGPFKAFENHSTTPTDMMTIDPTLWVEDGTPYMVFSHEWVQITDGTIEYMQLKPDLSAAAGEPVKLFRASSAKWTESIEEGGHVTDGAYLWKGKTGKLYMIWSSRDHTQRYMCGIAISDSGKLAGPWRQQDKPIFDNDGGDGMLFTTFDGKLMMVLHAPDHGPGRPHIFEMEDTGETLRIAREVTDDTPEPGTGDLGRD
jgi:GH43 family beta-xylosidase